MPAGVCLRHCIDGCYPYSPGYPSVQLKWVMASRASQQHAFLRVVVWCVVLSAVVCAGSLECFERPYKRWL